MVSSELGENYMVSKQTLPSVILEIQKGIKD